MVNLIKIALWQHFMNSVVCFHPRYIIFSFNRKQDVQKQRLNKLYKMSQPHFGQVWGWSPTLGKVGG